MPIRSTLFFLTLLCHFGVASAAEMEITPFTTSNQSPLLQIYGLPRDTGADIVPPGLFRIGLSMDTSSNYTVAKGLREQITLDGETCRMAFTTRFGVTPSFEAGVEIPYYLQGGGFLDGFIIDWHNTFGLPQGGRDTAPKNRINYSYRTGGVQKLQVERSSSGIGDISLTGGFRLYDLRDTVHHDRLSLKGSVKLPTGDSSLLFGSGSTDMALQLCGSMINFSEWGSLGVFGSVGALAMTRSDVLRDQHKSLAGTGTVGIGWGPASWLSFKAQLNGNTPLYSDSSLVEISNNAVMILFGGALKFPGEYLLDIGVAEDISVGTAPDVSFHLNLSKQF
ncbi:MAG TPA: DUF3187 family protein [Desulfuromonadales bacterium]|nr:DUF3187 family protein [Desulfuromonadales bacterium]